MTSNDPRSRRSRESAGYTLIEILISMASSTLLISGLASTLYISSQALNLDERPARQSSIAAEAIGDMMTNLRYARRFSERTATTMTFTVPDRNNDGLPETIRYAWSGTSGDPLTYQYNNGSVLSIAHNVQNFNLLGITRLLLNEPLPLPTVATPVFAEFAEQKVSSEDTLVNINVPAGTVAGDLLIAAIATDGNNTTSLLAAIGWNTINIGDRSGQVTLGVWWKIATASEPSAHLFTWSNAEQAYGWMMRFTGHDPSNPIHAVATGTGQSTTPTSPAVVNSIDNTLVVRIGGFDKDKITVDSTSLSGHTTITMDSSGSGASSTSGGAGYFGQATAGDSGSVDFELTDSNHYRTVTIAIGPNPTP